MREASKGTTAQKKSWWLKVHGVPTVSESHFKATNERLHSISHDPVNFRNLIMVILIMYFGVGMWALFTHHAGVLAFLPLRYSLPQQIVYYTMSEHNGLMDVTIISTTAVTIYIPGLVLIPSHTLSRLILTLPMWGRYYYSYSTEEEMEAQGLITIAPELEIGRVRIPAQACLTPRSPALESKEVCKLAERVLGKSRSF